MSWLVLVASGVLEAVWAIALDRSDGFSRLTPSVVFLVALALSMGGLGYAARASGRHLLRRLGGRRSRADRLLRDGLRR